MNIAVKEIVELSKNENWNLNDFINFMMHKVDLTNDNHHYIEKSDFELFLKAQKWIKDLDENPAFNDTIELFNRFNDKNKIIDLLKNNVYFVEKSTHFEVGKKLWLEIEITDEYMSNMIFAHMYTNTTTTKKLPTDVYGNSTAMGYRILTVSQIDGNLTIDEKEILTKAQDIINKKLLNK